VSVPVPEQWNIAGVQNLDSSAAAHRDCASMKARSPEGWRLAGLLFAHGEVGGQSARTNA
jgi:hypothetical protein